MRKWVQVPHVSEFMFLVLTANHGMYTDYNHSITLRILSPTTPAVTFNKNFILHAKLLPCNFPCFFQFKRKGTPVCLILLLNLRPRISSAIFANLYYQLLNLTLDGKATNHKCYIWTCGSDFVKGNNFLHCELN